MVACDGKRASLEFFGEKGDCGGREGFCSIQLMVRMGRLTGKYKEGMENLTFSGSFRFMMGDGTHLLLAECMVQ